MSEQTDPRTLAALRLDRDALTPEDAQERIAQRLGVSVPHPPRTAPRRTGGARGGGGARSLSLLAVTFLAGVVAGMGVSALRPPRVVYVGAPPIAAPAPTGPVAGSLGNATAASPVEAPAATPEPAPAAPPAAPPRLRQLDAERALLDAARAALVGGDSDTALRALDRYAKLYRRPLLGEERDALFVQALVRAGRYDEARQRAADLRRRAPNSLVLPAVDAAIASIP